MSFALAALALQAYSMKKQEQASNAQVKSQKSARDLDQRMASIENQRTKRKAIAQQRVEEARLVTAAAADNTSGSSAVQGALTGSAADTAGRIGFANTRSAAATQRGNILQSGIDKAAGFNNQAGWAQVGAAGFNSAQSYQERREL